MFVHPLIEEQNTEPGTYIQTLKDQEAVNQPFPFSIGQLQTGFTEYYKAFEIQEVLLKYEYNICVAEYLQKLPNISRVGIGAMVNEGWNDNTWLQKHHPDVLIRQARMDDEDHNAGNEFVYRVFGILSTVGAQPEEFCFMDGHGLGDNWDWSKVDVHSLAHLKVFDFQLRGAESADEPSNPNWRELLRPLQTKAASLEALYIHIGRSGRGWQRPCQTT